MASHHRTQALFQGRHVEATGEAPGERQVIDRLAGFELLEEPQALLGIGQRQARLWARVAEVGPAGRAQSGWLPRCSWPSLLR